MKSNLPDGWAWSTLGEIANWSSGGTPTAGNTTYYGGDIPWVVIGDLNEGYVTTSAKTLTELGLQKSSAKYAPVGSVLVAMYGASIGKLGIAGIRCTTNQAIAFTERIHPVTSTKYLFHYLSLMKDELVKLGQGGAQPNISQTILKGIKIPIAPLNEQQRIVEQLEVLLQKLNSNQERLEKLPELLKKFRQAVLAAAVSGKLTEAWRAEQPQGETGADLLDCIRAERRAQWEAKQRAKLSGKQLSLNEDWKMKYEEPAAPDNSELPELPEGWTWAAVEQLAKVGTGATPLKSNSNYYEGGSIPWVTSGALNNLLIRTAEDHITPLAVAETNAKIFPVGTLLVALYGEGKTRGKVSELAIEAATNQACAAIVFDLAATAVRDFIKLFFRKNYEDLRKLAAGGVQPNLNLGLIKTTCVPFPPLAEQQEIVRQINHYFELADQLEARFEQAAALVEQLPQALLAKAFSGLLVPQDPNDEPASALLERLQSGAEAPTKGKRGRKPKAMANAPLFE